jgi:hypothetical protein
VKKHVVGKKEFINGINTFKGIRKSNYTVFENDIVKKRLK